MRKVIVCGLLAGLWIVALCHAAAAQSCGSSYSYRSYPYAAPTYSYATPSYSAPYVAPAKYVEKPYKAEAYFTRLVAFFPVLDVPTYGAAVYAPPPVATPQTQAPAAAQAQPGGDLAKIMSALTTINKAVDLIDQRLTRLEGPPAQAPPRQAAPAPKQQPGPPPKQEQPQTAQEIVGRKCAVCHNAEKAGDWGGGLTMVTADGKLEKLSSKTVVKLTKHCMAGTMPPKADDLPKGFTGKAPEPLTDQEASALVSHYSGATKDARQERLEISEARPAPRTLVRK